MRFLLASTLLLLSFAGHRSAAADPTVAILTGPSASPPELAAAADLQSHLASLFPSEIILTAKDADSAATRIVVGTRRSTKDLLPANTGIIPKEAGGFVVGTLEQNGKTGAYILGSDPEGVANGVFRLLEKLGFGFYLSFEISPPPQKAFTFEGWDISAFPLVPDRLVLNWHNFLSGCSAWNLADWNAWTDASQRMGYNTIMVHAYGNNPMTGFTLNGTARPVGLLTSTRIGRDWCTMHVNNVQHLFGGNAFTQPVFGSNASVDGTDANRTAAARQLMSDVFQYATNRGMNVTFAVDVDTESANPQKLVTLLPESARFKSGDFWLPNPETPDGYGYYKAMTADLMDAYPQITTLVAWFRCAKTPWMNLQAKDLPPAWRREFDAEIAADPSVQKLWQAPSLFAIGKITRALRKALDESGHTNVRLAAGTWEFVFLPAANRFFPNDVSLIGLDYQVLHNKSVFEIPDCIRAIADVAKNRTVIPVTWAHHDDGSYVGRPFTPFPDFYTKLGNIHCAKSGFGVIHWTTRPLDLFFKNMVDQVWSDRKNQTIRQTADRLAAQLGLPDSFAAYLVDWATTAPKFARETSDMFSDEPLKLDDALRVGFARRRSLLASIDTSSLREQARNIIAYFQGLEDYAEAVHMADVHVQNAVAAAKQGDYETARNEISQCHPEKVVEDYTRFSSLGGITPGEKGLIVSMNTRWISHFERLRQALGMAPVRVNFGTTRHDPLAQAPGHLTFFFTPTHQIWETLGTKETGAEIVSVPPENVARVPGIDPDWTEIFATSIKTKTPIGFTVQPFLDIHGGREYIHLRTLQPGDYTLRVLLIEPEHNEPGKRIIDVDVLQGPMESMTLRFPPRSTSRMRLVLNGNDQNAWNSLREVSVPGQVIDPLTPTASKSEKQFPPAHAFDGNPDTRWASFGNNVTLEWAVDPKKPVSQTDLTWHEGASRNYNFDLQAMDEKGGWKTITQPASAPSVASEKNIDVFARAGGKNRPLVISLPVSLKEPGKFLLRITPRTGDAILSGVVLEPVPTS